MPLINQKEFWGFQIHLSIHPVSFLDGILTSHRDQSNPLAEYFMPKLEDGNLVEVELVKLDPTWRNHYVGEDINSKQIKHFLLSIALVDNLTNIKNWIKVGGVSDHSLILLEIRGSSMKPTNPFKMKCL